MTTDVIEVVNSLGWGIRRRAEQCHHYAPSRQEADKFLDEAVEQLKKLLHACKEKSKSHGRGAVALTRLARQQSIKCK
jgi:hypothetical protein